jgi:hypothetical protein
MLAPPCDGRMWVDEPADQNEINFALDDQPPD